MDENLVVDISIVGNGNDTEKKEIKWFLTW